MTTRRHDPRARPLIVGNRTGGPPQTDLAIAALDILVGPSPCESTAEAPRTRGDCIDGPRPCPWVSCRHHLAIGVTRFGGLSITWPGLEIEAIGYTCSLDVADDGGGMLLDEIGEILNVTRERVRQIEARALAKMASGLAQWRERL